MPPKQTYPYHPKDPNDGGVLNWCLFLTIVIVFIIAYHTIIK